jgi:hypothetical protein
LRFIRTVYLNFDLYILTGLVVAAAAGEAVGAVGGAVGGGDGICGDRPFLRSFSR